MKISYDTHLHSEFSMDSDTPVLSQVHRAIELGLTGICLTDHMDYGFPIDQCPGCKENPFQFDVNEYLETLHTIKNETKNLELLIGVECGLQTDSEVIDANRKLAENPAFDQVIGSIHLIEKKDPYYDTLWGEDIPENIIKKYFTITLENLQSFSDFNILGHLDYAVRYSPDSFDYRPKDYFEITDEIMKYIIKKDIALEVNTSGIHRAKRATNRNTNPHPDLLKRYYELGGRLISVGSDAHSPESLAGEFDATADMLTAIGFKEYVTYKNRQAIPHSF